MLHDVMATADVPPMWRPPLDSAVFAVKLHEIIVKVTEELVNKPPPVLSAVFEVMVHQAIVTTPPETGSERPPP